MRYRKTMCFDRIRNFWRIGFLLCLPVAVIAVAGCSSNANNAEEGGSIVDAPLGLDEAGSALKQIQVEEFVKVCMKTAGFDYVPVDPNATKAAIVGAGGLTDDEYRRQFGYGISTVFEKVVEISQSANSADPNVVYRRSLDAAGQAAFDKTLTGGNTDLSVSGAVDAAKAGDLSGLGGCIGEATNQVFGATNVVTALAKIEELDARAEADPRLVAARAAWSTCMKKRGLDYSEPNAIDGALFDRLAGLVGQAAAKSVGETGTFSPLVFGATIVPDYDKAALGKLQAEELETAQADLECEEEFVADIEDEVKGEYEKKFADENAALISRASAELGLKK